MSLVEVKVPDIGDFADVPVIDLFVKVGDSIKIDDAIATLESDKATMDVPCTVEGTVKEVLVQLGSRVSEGAVLIKVEAGAAAAARRPPRQRQRPGRSAGRRLPRLPHRPRPATAARPISSATCSSSAPAPAATRPPSARPTSA